MHIEVEVNNLEIEITRRCNQFCAHCMRACSQNVDITPDALKRLLDTPNYKIVRINNIYLSGGEILLNPDAINALIDLLIELNIKVGTISGITNGLLYNEKVYNKLREINEVQGTKVALITVMDQYHQIMDKEIYEKNMNSGLYSYKYIPVDERSITPIGNARKNKLGKFSFINNKYWSMIGSKNVEVYPTSNNNLYIPSLYIGANNQIGKEPQDSSWKMLDRFYNKNVYDNCILENAEVTARLYTTIKSGVRINLGERFNRDYDLALYNGTLNKFLENLTIRDIRNYLTYPDINSKKSNCKRKILCP